MTAEVLRAIHGIEIFPVISLVLFVVVFGVALIWTSRLDRRRLDRFSRLPLDGPVVSGGSRSREEFARDTESR
jgi:hypothetical protein